MKLLTCLFLPLRSKCSPLHRVLKHPQSMLSLNIPLWENGLNEIYILCREPNVYIKNVSEKNDKAGLNFVSSASYSRPIWTIIKFASQTQNSRPAEVHSVALLVDATSPYWMYSYKGIDRPEVLKDLKKSSSRGGQASGGAVTHPSSPSVPVGSAAFSNVTHGIRLVYSIRLRLRNYTTLIRTSHVNVAAFNILSCKNYSGLSGNDNGERWFRLEAYFPQEEEMRYILLLFWNDTMWCMEWSIASAKCWPPARQDKDKAKGEAVPVLN